MQTDNADDMIANGIETDSYAKSNVVPEYKPSSHSWLKRTRQAGTVSQWETNVIKNLAHKLYKFY